MNTRRIQLVDALRGFALFGILVVNIPYFATAYYAGSGLADPHAISWLDDAASWIMVVVFESKFYVLFSLLFGYSFVLQMQSAERDGKRFGPRMLRRLLGLFVLGALHAVFLWFGDILMLYACVGLILFFCRNASPKNALIAAGLIVAGYTVLLAWIALVMQFADDSFFQFDRGEEIAYANQVTTAYRGSFGDVMVQRLEDLVYAVPWTYLGQGPIVLAMFLTGLAAAKVDLFGAPATRRQFFKLLFWIGLPVGLAGGAVWAYGVFEIGLDEQLGWLALAIATPSALLLMGAYVSVFALGSTTGLGRTVIGALAPVGRMALTNYLLQSVVLGLIFYGYGFGLFGKVGPFETLLIAIGVFAVQVAFSHLWMGRFRYGPVEWMLRAFTYLELPGRTASAK